MAINDDKLTVDNRSVNRYTVAKGVLKNGFTDYTKRKGHDDVSSLQNERCAEDHRDRHLLRKERHRRLQRKNRSAAVQSIGLHDGGLDEN